MKIMKFLLFIFIFIFSFNCIYENPFAEMADSDLISALDLSADWTLDPGLQIVVTTGTQTPPSGEADSYSLSLQNLINANSSDFEAGTLGSWVSANSPGVFTAVNLPGEMTGSWFMELRLVDNQYVYYNFTADLSNDYLFKFNYKCVEDQSSIILSAGIAGTSPYDTVTLSVDTILGESGIQRFNIPCSISTNYQVRFGLRDTLSSLSHNYIDEIALFPVSNDHSINKDLNLSDSGAPHINDGTGKTFYEGIYKMTLYAMSDTSSKITLRLGTTYKEFTLTSSWKQIKIEADILIDQEYLKMGICPTYNNINQRFPGAVYITKPKLYFLL